MGITRLRWGLLALALLLLTSGCAQLGAQMDGAEQDGAGSSASVDTHVLETVEWGQVNGLLSVLVRNTTDRVLRHADAVISVKGRDGTALGSTAASTIEGRCCTAIEVAPGASFGFYFYLDDAASVGQVDVTYKNVLWAAAGRTRSSQTSIAPLRLQDNAAGTLLVADVTTKGDPIDAAVVQALIDGPDGKFLAVISGTWFCFAPGAVPDRIKMQLYTKVPRGSTVRSVTAFPLPDKDAAAESAGRANLQGSCDPQGDDSGRAAEPDASS
ncbi:hypothetical protein [Nocardioides plantarum]|uniref:Lipoprotein n=1 Tax=Nocardioides plantarum TaxID=29299 RepID=A0ABV5K512_9ACTN|nr:hypothetical protein [Nocardioides plantarum]